MVAKGAASSRPPQPLTAHLVVRPSTGPRSSRKSVITSLVARWALRVARGEPPTAADHAASRPSASTSVRCDPGPREGPCLADQPWPSNDLSLLAACAVDQSLSSASSATRSGRSSWARIVSATAIVDFDQENECDTLPLSGG